MVDNNGKFAIINRFFSSSRVFLILLVIVSVMTFLTFKKFVEVGKVVSPADAQIKKLTQVINDNPNSLSLRLKLAFTFQNAKRFDEAITQYNEALKFDSGNQEALYNLAVIAREKGDLDEAFRMFSTLLAEHPGHVLGSVALGELYLQKRKYDAVIKVVDDCLRTKPGIIELHMLKAKALEGMREYNAAVAEYREVLKYVPDDKRALDAIERIY